MAEKQEAKVEIIKESIGTLGKIGEKAPKLEGTPSGVEGLDELFFISTFDKRRKPVRKPLGGYPKYGVINLTGISDTGKSLMAEQFAIKQATLGNNTAFVTVETPGNFLAASLRERAKAMNVKYEEIEDKIIIVDAASYSILREDPRALLNTLDYVINHYKVVNTIIDSVTGLYEAKEMMARQVVRQLFNFMKKNFQTAIFVSQKRSGHEELSAEAAGGYAISHIVDCSIVVAKKPILTTFDERLFNLAVGDMIRLLRIDGCRMCGHTKETMIMEITEEGLVRVTKPLKSFLKGGK